MERFYKYAAIFASIILTSVISTYMVISFIKGTVREAIVEVCEPIKNEVDDLKARVDKALPIIAQHETSLTLLTYRVNTVEKSRTSREFIKPSEPKNEDVKDDEEDK